MGQATGTAVRSQPVAGAGPSLHDRILDATVACIAEAGVLHTTIDDIARAAACSRATVYRTFSGGRDAILAAAGTREVQRFLATLGHELEDCRTLDEALITGISRTARQLHHHDALRFVARHEPAVLRPLVAFDGLDPLLAGAAAFAEVHLTRFVGPACARALGEWAARLVVAYADDPVTEAPVDLTDESATGRLVRTFLLPGLAAWQPADRPAGITHTSQE